MAGEVELEALMELAAFEARSAEVSSAEASSAESAVLSEIAARAQAIAMRAARAHGVSAEAAEDVAQVTTEKVLLMLSRGKTPERNAAGLVWRIAANAAKDVHRRRKRRHVTVFDETAGAVSSAAAFSGASSQVGGHELEPERALIRGEQAETTRRLVREAIECAPENYRVALEQHLAGVPIEEVAEAHFEAMLTAGEVGEEEVSRVRAQKKARNRADQHLSRGRKWLRSQLQAAMDAGEL